MTFEIIKVGATGNSGIHEFKKLVVIQIRRQQPQYAILTKKPSKTMTTIISIKKGVYYHR